MNTLDIIVIVVVLLSAALAFARGFIREVLSIVSWIGAAVIAYYGYSYVAPFAERFLPKGPFANLAAAAGVFIVALIVLSILTAAISRRVSQSKLSSFDRVFGLIFGVVRGAILVSLAYLALNWFLPPEKPRPDWIAQARSLPMLQSGANTIESLVPAGFRERALTTATEAGAKVVGQSEADTAMRALSLPRPSNKPAPDAAKPPTYDPKSQQELNRLSDQVQGQPPQK
jgi:membrane protein required for colicin V production